MTKPFTARSLVGMTMGARKRNGITQNLDLWDYLDKRLRPCPGCDKCGGCRWVNGVMLDIYIVICDGSGALPARRSK